MATLYVHHAMCIISIERTKYDVCGPIQWQSTALRRRLYGNFCCYLRGNIAFHKLQTQMKLNPFGRFDFGWTHVKAHCILVMANWTQNSSDCITSMCSKQNPCSSIRKCIKYKSQVNAAWISNAQYVSSSGCTIRHHATRLKSKFNFFS